jgi:hypothetical protein
MNNTNCVNIKMPSRTLVEFKQTDKYKAYCSIYNKDYKMNMRRCNHVKDFRTSIHGLKLDNTIKNNILYKYIEIIIYEELQ